MSKEEQLQQAMRDLQETSAGGASSGAEVRVMAAFRKRHATNSPWKWAAMGAVAASILIASAMRLSTPSAVEAPAAIVSAPALPAVVVRPAVVPAIAPPRPRRRVRPATRVAKSKEIPFQAIPYAPPLAEGDALQVIRVRLPADYGRRIEADVLSGQDGIARAIRFVR